jgi:hypothetical protein
LAPPALASKKLFYLDFYRANRKLTPQSRLSFRLIPGWRSCSLLVKEGLRKMRPIPKMRMTKKERSIRHGRIQSNQPQLTLEGSGHEASRQQTSKLAADLKQGMQNRSQPILPHIVQEEYMLRPRT